MRDDELRGSMKRTAMGCAISLAVGVLLMLILALVWP